MNEENIKTDLYKAYKEAIYDLNAEIFFNVAYEETSKGVYKLNKGINEKIFLKDEIKDKERKEVIEKFRKNLFEGDINIIDDKNNVKKKILKDDFKEKLNHFNDVFYKKKKEDLIVDINKNVFN